MSTLLIINPNTSESVTAALAQAARVRFANTVRVEAVTAGFGAPYISSEQSLAVAQHATLDARTRALQRLGKVDATLIACFGDPGLHALEEVGEEPVIGLAQASMRAAAQLGAYAIVTGGHAWQAPLRRLAFALELLEPLAAIETVSASGAELAADPDAGCELLTGACLTALSRAAAAGRPARSIIIGGAGLLGLAPIIARRIPVPLLDSVQYGLASAGHAMGIEPISPAIKPAPDGPTSFPGIPLARI